jgi:Ricin-type beta-trefoil lectin domain/Putative Ig domain
MRVSIKAGRRRVLAVAASVLLSGAALAAATMPAQAIAPPGPPPPPVLNTITLPTLGAQTTDPIAAAVLPIKATETDQAATLTFAVTGAPAGPFSFAAQPLAAGNFTADLDAAFTKAYTGTVTVTVSDDVSPADTVTEAFTWTAKNPVANKIAVTAPATKTVWLGVAVSLKVTATDSAADQTLTWTDTGLPPGLAINPTTGVISGRPTRLEAKPFTTVVKATDGTGSAGSATIKWYVAVPVNIPYSGTLTTTVGQWLAINPFTYRDAVPGDRPTFSVTGLPSGMGFQTDPMLIFGWPAAGGTYHVTIHERGSLGSADAMAFKLVVRAAPLIGAIGQIHLPFAGKCLQDPGNAAANGTRIDIANCVAGATQRWTVASDNTIRVNGRCLSVVGNGSSAGRQLDLWSCVGSPRQHWTQGTAGDLVNPASGLCVTDPGSSKRNGTMPVMGACFLRSYEQWTLPAQRVLTALGGSCLDTSGAALVGGRVDMFWCKYSGSRWTFEQDGTIRMFGNKCITVNNKNRAVIGLCSGRNFSQKWAIIRTSPMGSELAERGVCLAIPSMTTARGTALELNDTQLIVSRCNETDPRDLWHIE